MIKRLCLIMVFVSIACWMVFAQEGTLQQSMKRGQVVYADDCGSCHQPAGQGLQGVFPPLANTAYLKNQQRAIGIVLNGQEGEIIVNGKKYNTPMAAMSNLTDTEIADVLNFVSNSWGNKNPMIKVAQVKAVRK